MTLSTPPPGTHSVHREHDVRVTRRMTVILPFLEQGNILNATKLELSVIDPRNWPPNWGTNQAARADVKTIVCPSTPSRTIDLHHSSLGSLGPPRCGSLHSGAPPIMWPSVEPTTLSGPPAPHDADPSDDCGVLGTSRGTASIPNGELLTGQGHDCRDHRRNVEHDSDRRIGGPPPGLFQGLEARPAQPTGSGRLVAQCRGV